MSQYDQASEWKLAQEIIHLHDDLGMGFRRVAKELTSQGWKANKDSANLLYNKYKISTSAEFIDNKDLKHLKLVEARQRQRFEVQKEIEGVRYNLTVLFVERSTLTFEQRKRLFTDPTRLLRFAGRVMPVIDPMLWDEFKQYCETRGYDITEAISIVMEEQSQYEAQSTHDEQGKQRLDSYLRNNLREYLDAWIADEQEEFENQKGQEPKLPIGSEEGTETITIEFPDGYIPQ